MAEKGVHISRGHVGSIARSLSNQSSGGSKRVTTQQYKTKLNSRIEGRLHRGVVKAAEQGKYPSAEELKSDIGAYVSSQTIRNHMHAMEALALVKRLKYVRHEAHDPKLRLKWVGAMLEKYDPKEMEKVMAYDEKSFCLDAPLSNRPVWASTRHQQPSQGQRKLGGGMCASCWEYLQGG